MITNQSDKDIVKVKNRDKVKVVLGLSNYATKKELEHATGVDTSDLAGEKDFINCFEIKAKVDMLDRDIKVSDSSTLIQTYQYNTGKQNLEKKLEN